MGEHGSMSVTAMVYVAGRSRTQHMRLSKAMKIVRRWSKEKLSPRFRWQRQWRGSRQCGKSCYEAARYFFIAPFWGNHSRYFHSSNRTSLRADALLHIESSKAKHSGSSQNVQIICHIISYHIISYHIYNNKKGLKCSTGRTNSIFIHINLKMF